MILSSAQAIARAACKQHPDSLVNACAYAAFTFLLDEADYRIVFDWLLIYHKEA